MFPVPTAGPQASRRLPRSRGRAGVAVMEGLPLLSPTLHTREKVCGHTNPGQGNALTPGTARAHNSRQERTPRCWPPPRRDADLLQRFSGWHLTSLDHVALRGQPSRRGRGNPLRKQWPRGKKQRTGTHGPPTGKGRMASPRVQWDKGPIDPIPCPTRAGHAASPRRCLTRGATRLAEGRTPESKTPEAELPQNKPHTQPNCKAGLE